MSQSEHQRRTLAVLATGRQLSLAGMSLETKVGMRATAHAASLLVVRGFIERGIDGGFTATPTGIAHHESGKPMPSGPLGPRSTLRTPRNNLRQRVWAGMRILKRFGVDDLVTCAARTGDKHPHNSIQKYLRALCAAGIVVRLPQRVPGTAMTSNGSAVFRLLRDTGEHAPAIKRGGTLVDRNEVTA